VFYHRVDHSLVMGQSSTLRLTLHGNHINRRVACYSFSIPVMKVALVCASSMTNFLLLVDPAKFALITERVKVFK